MNSLQPDVLPSSVATRPTGAKLKDGAWWVPIFCANCGADGGFVPEEAISTGGFCFYLCPKCEKFGIIAGTYCEPDAAFWARVHGEQMEKYGRLLTAPELRDVLAADDSSLALLIKEGPKP